MGKYDLTRRLLIKYNEGFGEEKLLKIEKKLGSQMTQLTVSASLPLMEVNVLELNPKKFLIYLWLFFLTRWDSGSEEFEEATGNFIFQDQSISTYLLT